MFKKRARQNRVSKPLDRVLSKKAVDESLADYESLGTLYEKKFRMRVAYEARVLALLDDYGEEAEEAFRLTAKAMRNIDKKIKKLGGDVDE